MWRWLAAANGAPTGGTPSTSSRGGSSDAEAGAAFSDDAAAVVSAAVSAAARGPLATMAGVAFFRLSDRLIGFTYGACEGEERGGRVWEGRAGLRWHNVARRARALNAPLPPLHLFSLPSNTEEDATSWKEAVHLSALSSRYVMSHTEERREGGGQASAVRGRAPMPAVALLPRRTRGPAAAPSSPLFSTTPPSRPSRTLRPPTHAPPRPPHITTGTRPPWPRPPPPWRRRAPRPGPPCSSTWGPPGSHPLSMVRGATM